MRDMSIFTEHDLIRCFAVHFRGFQFAVEQFDISTTAIDVLFMFDRVLDDEVFAFIAERSELFGQCVEPGVLRRLDTLVGLSVVVESAGAVHELAKLFAGVFRVCPFVFPRTCGNVIIVKLEHENSFGNGLESRGRKTLRTPTPRGETT